MGDLDIRRHSTDSIAYRARQLADAELSHARHRDSIGARAAFAVIPVHQTIGYGSIVPLYHPGEPARAIAAGRNRYDGEVQGYAGAKA